MRKILYVLIGLIVLLVVAVFALPPLLGPSVIVPRVADAVRDATGRELRIEGDFSLSLFPSVKVSAGGIKLSNAPGAAAPEMLSLAGLELEMPLLPLIGKEVIVERLVLREPVIALEKDAEGRANWEMAGAAAEPAAEPAPAAPGAEPPLAGLALGDVRIENGQVSFSDAATGQTQRAESITLTAALADIASPLSLAGEASVNGEAVTLALKVDSPGAAMAGQAITVESALKSALIELGYAGNLQQQPVPGLDGQFDLDIGSVGALLAWLSQPLPEGQPDPGPLMVTATFKADGGKATLEQARIEGEALQASATGSFDGTGEVKRIMLKVESGVLDIDRYLPPRAAAPKAAEADAPDAPPDPEAMIAGLSDEPLDLSALKGTEADIEVALGGIKLQGYEIGAVGLNATLTGGVLTAELSELGLYGGKVSGRVGLDGAGEALVVDADVTVDKAGVGELAKVAVPEGPPPVGGVLSGVMQLSAEGASPRALAESALGHLVLDLGGVKVQDARAAKLTEMNLAVELPGIDAAPNLEASLVYNAKRVDVAMTLAPLKEVLSGAAFPLEVKLDSKMIALGYAGTVQQQPVPGLDGQFDLNVGSVGQLLAWLDQPLPEGQPDPGPLKVAATFTGDGQRATLEQATIEGKALKATATGSFDGSGPVKKVALNLESGVLDIDSYLPPPAEQPAAAAKPKAGPPPRPQDVMAALSDEPIDLSGLKGTEADVKVAMGGIKVRGYEVGPVGLTVALAGGVLSAELSQLGLYGGNVAGNVKLDASGQALGVDAAVKIDSAGLGELAKVATPEGPPPVGGVLSGELNLAAQGASPKALAESAKGRLALDLGGVKVEDERAAALTELKFEAEIRGTEGPRTMNAEAVYNAERVQVAMNVAPIADMFASAPFPLEIKLSSAPITAGYSGKVQMQPVPGLDGQFDLDVGSVGALLAWLGQPLPADQPDPGPLKVAARFAADGAKAALEEATVDGKAFKARAVGSFDRSGELALFNADVTVDELNLDAYLPPPKEEPAKAEKTDKGEQQPAAKAQGWSEEPFDLAGLRQAQGEVKVTTGPVTFRELAIQSSKAALTLQGGVLKAVLEQLALAEGAVTAAATVDGSGEALGLAYDAKVDKIQAKPFLKAFSQIDWLTGTGNFAAKGTGQGRSQKELVASLNGEGSFQFLDGAIEGVNLAEVLRRVGSLGMAAQAGETPRTDFTELSGSYVITNGVLDNQDMKMLAPLIRLGGSGQVAMPPQTVDYLVEAEIVGTLEGQGGAEAEALAGLPIPIRVTGPWSGLNYEVDWAAAFQEAAKDPERLKRMPAELSEKAKAFGVNLPVPGEGVGKILEQAPGVTDAVKGVTGGEGAAGAAATGALQKLLPGEQQEGEASPTDALKQLVPGQEETGKEGEPSPMDSLQTLIQPKQQEPEQAPAQQPEPAQEAAPEQQPQAATEPAPAEQPAAAEPQPEQKPKSSEEKLIDDAGKALKGLFGD